MRHAANLTKTTQNPLDEDYVFSIHDTIIYLIHGLCNIYIKL